MLIKKVDMQIAHGWGTNAKYRTLELCYGPINDFAEEDRVDFLCVSALPNDYYPSPESKIGKLYQKGIDVAALAKDKEADYRENSYCWISKAVPQNLPGIKFKKLVVFEADPVKVNMLDNLTNIFAVINKHTNSAKTSIALPMMGSSKRKIPEADMLTGLFYAAVTWQSREFPLEKVKLVAEDASTITSIESTFKTLKQNYTNLMDLKLLYSYPTYAAAGKEQVKRLIANKTMPSYLSERQAFGIYIYTTGYYSIINSVLRSEPSTSTNYKTLMPLFESIDSGLANIPNYTGVASRWDNLTEQRIREYEVGKDVVHLAYTSSTRLSQLQLYTNFAAANANSSARFTITSQTGSHIASLSKYQSENEVLFGRLMINHVESRNIAVNPMLFNITEKVKPI